MELRILRYFLAVAEEQSFSRAAEHLHVSQPALSQQLRAYEEEIGSKLFVRSPKRIELTDKGRVLLRHARDIVELATRTEESLKNAAHLVQEGLGSAICIDGLIPAVFSGKLVFRPFSPTLTSDAYLAWKRGKTPSPAAQALLALIKHHLAAVKEALPHLDPATGLNGASSGRVSRRSRRRGARP